MSKRIDNANPGWLKGKPFPPLKEKVLDQLLVKGTASGRELGKLIERQFRLSAEDARTVLR
jgi:hypothetical protein